MILYHAAGSCSEGLKLLLDLAGATYSLELINFAEGDQTKPAFLAINPKGKVPALRLIDGEIITEYPVISQYIADTFPQAGLLPSDPRARREALSWIEFIVSTLHMRGATLCFRPERFSARPEAVEDIRAAGKAVVADGFQRLSDRLGEGEFFGERAGALDAAAFYLMNWAPRIGLTLPDNLAALSERLHALR